MAETTQSLDTFSGTGWGAPSNAGASDNAYASISIADFDTTNRLVGYLDGGFGIPADATITAVTATVEMKVAAGKVCTFSHCYPVIAGSEVTTTNYAPGSVIATSDTEYEVDLAAAFTLAQLNGNAGFAVAAFNITGDEGTAIHTVDHMYMTVVYTTPTAGSGSITRRLFGGYRDERQYS